jgi:hypothetical protein
MPRHLLALSLLALVVPGRAFAVAHHEQTVVQKLRDPQTKQVVGFRVHALIDPEGYDHARLNVGSLHMVVPPPAPPAPGVVPAAQPDARALGSGMTPGYVRAMVIERQNIPLRAGSPNLHELIEVKVDVRYGAGNNLKPGDKVDIYSAFRGAANPGYWHIFGMHDGPVQKNDVTYVHELPTDTSAHAEATETP